METHGVERKLTAILATDVVGYSRLMGADEVGTLTRLKAHRNELIDPAIAEHHGRIVGTAGDSLLAEFASAVDAVRCAIALQRAMGERNADVPEEQRIEFRVGVNVGDVIVDGDDIFGDGVNVAARLEGLAEPGGICVSLAARDQVRDKVDIEFDDLGEHQVKNITRPVHVFRIPCAPKPSAALGGADSESDLALPDKPSIAVLPFDNLSRDPEQDYFADGITEDIITELSRFRSLFVIARNSTFVYKGQAVKVQDVGKDLGVQYVVEGSVRKAGNRVRVTAQLVESATGQHVWAERFDRDLEDIFAVQDEVTETVVSTVAGRLEAAGVDQAKRKRTDNLPAYDCLLRAVDHHHKRSAEDNRQALELLDKAIELDPGYAHAHAWRACTIGQAWVWRYPHLGDPEKAMDGAFESLQTALTLDDDDSEPHRVLGAIHLHRRQYDQSLYHLERGLALNHNDDRIVAQMGELLTYTERPDDGIEWIEKALRLNPYHPDGRSNDLGRALFVARRYADAAAAFKRVPKPNYVHHAYLAACHAYMGEDEAARAQAARVREMTPDFSAETFLETLPYKSEADRAHHREGLQKAGL